jgi:hypothetical protein
VILFAARNGDKCASFRPEKADCPIYNILHMEFRTLRTFFVILSGFLPFAGQAQCSYTLEMFDSFGDGWNNGTLTISVDGVPSTYTLNGINDNGQYNSVNFTVIDGAPLVFSYVQGSFIWEVSFRVYDNVGQLLFQITAPPTGTLFTGVGSCVKCAPVQALELENVWDNRARVRWQPNFGGLNAPVSWRVIYGHQGFVPGPGVGDTLVVGTNKANLLGLEKKTWYDVYVQQDCGPDGGLANLAGPLSFQTYWTNDVGVTDVISPRSSCDVTFDSVKFVMKNFGAAPQSLFVYRYAVNGQLAPVIPPADGFYTGILGKDSSVTIAFETLTNFSAPGEYRLDVFTQLLNDEDTQNDTFTYYFTNKLKANYTQNFENWNGGWRPSGQNPSWQYGAPNKPSMPSAASGQNAWVTSLSGTYSSSEYSYLESTCFDFSDLTAPPAIQFYSIREIENNYDGAWLEMSLNDGLSWQKVGDIGEGVNWYSEENLFSGLGKVWSGKTDGWQLTRHLLPGAEGKEKVRFRFAFGADPFVQQGGFGIDDLRVLKTFPKDLAGIGISTLGDKNECGLAADQIAFTFNNFGHQPQTGIKVAYSINGGAPVENNVVGTLLPDMSITHVFNVPFDSRDGAFNIKCWTVLNGDQDVKNDTASYFISHFPRSLPYQQDFEALTLPPSDWDFDPQFGFSVTSAHNNVSNVLAFNLWGSNPSFTAALPRMGTVQPGDSLRFTYRITNFASQGQTAAILQGGTKIEVQVSTDCGANYQTLYTINSFTHQPTVSMRERKLSLEAYVGQSVKIRFKGTWGTGDYWVDIDNINVLSCPSDMGLSAKIEQPSPGQSDGSATVNVGLGNPPYKFAWSNDSTGQTVGGLAAGNYTVTVTDAFGCSSEISFQLGNSAVLAPVELLGQFALFPNPTSGTVRFEALLNKASEAQAEIFSSIGQRVWSAQLPASERIAETIELGHLPNGIYLVRLVVEGKVYTRKLVKG